MDEKFVKNEPLLKHTNFRIGGPAKYFFEARDSQEMTSAVQWANEHNEPFFILGGGSNVLVSDNGFNGLVIKAASRNLVIPDAGGELEDTFSPTSLIQNNKKDYPLRLRRTSSDKKRIVYAGAGALSALVARKTAEAGLTGFEWAISLPGTIGGAIRGNAGCFGGEMNNVVSRVKILAPQEQFANSRELANYSWGRKVCEINNLDCAFSYRQSIFKQINPAPIILSAQLELKKDDPKKCLKRLRENLALRKEKQPLQGSSAGCIFKNYELRINNQGFNFHLPLKFKQAGLIPAGWLVEQAGLLGLKIGDAEVSTKHGNFVLNRGQARAQDVKNIIGKIKQTVFQKFGIKLEEEVQYVGF